MIQYEFSIEPERFERRIKSDIQHKVRVALKCYTVFNFNLNQEKRTFTFNSKYRQYPTKLIIIPKNKDGTPKLYKGRYEYEKKENGKINVSIFVEIEKSK